MKSKSDDLEQTPAIKSDTLERIVNRSEHIKQEVEQAAEELTSINETLNQDSKVSISIEKIKTAIMQNECVEHDIAKAAGDLEQVNSLLIKETDERVVIKSELADTKTDLAEVREDLRESQANERNARETALKDSLTGIPNRASFEQALEQGLAQARRHDWRLAVLFIDIDKFKSINDTYGHDQGDNVLRMVANHLQSSVREEDTACRWGGDEFVCLLLEVKQEADVISLAEKLVSQIAEPCEFNGTVLSVKTSIGIAIYPEDGETTESLFKNADTAMFKAKGTKKRVVLFHESSRD